MNLFPSLSIYLVFLVEMVNVSPPRTVKNSSVIFSMPVKSTSLSIRRKLILSSSDTSSASDLPLISSFDKANNLQKASFTMSNMLFLSFTNTGSPILLIIFDKLLSLLLKESSAFFCSVMSIKLTITFSIVLLLALKKGVALTFTHVIGSFSLCLTPIL